LVIGTDKILELIEILFKDLYDLKQQLRLMQIVLTALTFVK